MRDIRIENLHLFGFARNQPCRRTVSLPPKFHIQCMTESVFVQENGFSSAARKQCLVRNWVRRSHARSQRDSRIRAIIRTIKFRGSSIVHTVDRLELGFSHLLYLPAVTVLKHHLRSQSNLPGSAKNGMTGALTAILNPRLLHGCALCAFRRMNVVSAPLLFPSVVPDCLDFAIL